MDQQRGESPELAPMQTQARLLRLRALLADASCDALVVSAMHNITYLTGFSGSAGTLVVSSRDAVLYTDGRYAEQSRAEIARSGAEVEISVGTPALQQEELHRAVKGLGRLGLEAREICWSQQLLYADLLSGTDLVPTRGLVEQLRVTKDDGELARIERAADIADIALAQVKGRLCERPSEVEFAAELDFEMRRRGARGVAFETIVASGPNGARPHARPSERRIEEGDLVVVDCGALVDGYRSDMTRTFCVGDPKPIEMVGVLDAVLAAQRAGVRAVRPGAIASEVDAACRRSLEEDGYLDYFVHGTGHGVGLMIHEDPPIHRESTATLAEGAVVTVEPGVYLPGTGGARIEDTIAVTASGPRLLTKSTKDWKLS
jgi:Xaa-Pro aminopeptidase